MIKITIDSLRDFQACKLYYEYQYIKKIDPTNSTQKKTQALFKETLVSIINFFFYKKLSLQEPSYKSLEARWQRKWLKDASAYDITVSESSFKKAYPTDAFYTTKATAALLALHKFFANRPFLEVVLIDEPFTVSLNKEVSLDGSFDLILRAKKKDGSYKYHIYTWAIHSSTKSMDFWSTHFTAIDYAFRYRNNFDSNLDVSYYLWDFTGPEPGVRKFLIEVKDHKILKYWADELARTENFYPIRGLSSYCRTCKFDKQCKNWVPVEAEVRK